MPQLRTVVETQKRLHGDRHADKRQNGEHGHATDHADGGQRIVGADGAHRAIFHECIVGNDLRYGSANLQHERSRAQRKNLAHERPIHRKILAAQAQRYTRGLREVPHHGNAADTLAAHSSPRAADDAQAHTHDENRIENGAAYRADEHGKKRPVRRAAGTDEIIDAHTDDLEDAAQADDLNEVAGIGAHRIGGRRKREQRFDAGRHMSEHREQNGYQHAECEGIAQNMLGLAVLAFAQTKRAQRVAACADEHSNRQEHRHDRRCHAYGGKADFSCTVAKEYRVDNVVRAVHEHA